MTSDTCLILGSIYVVGIWTAPDMIGKLFCVVFALVWLVLSIVIAFTTSKKGKP